MVEDLKQHAFKNLTEWVPVCDSSFAGYPLLLENPAANSFMNPNLGLHGVNFQEQGNVTIRPVFPPWNFLGHNLQ